MPGSGSVTLGGGQLHCLDARASGVLAWRMANKTGVYLRIKSMKQGRQISEGQNRWHHIVSASKFACECKIILTSAQLNISVKINLDFRPAKERKVI